MKIQIEKEFFSSSNNKNEIHPIIVNKTDEIPKIIKAFTDYFSQNDLKELEKLLKGDEKNLQKLIFLGNANRFLDVIKLLMDNDILPKDYNKSINAWVRNNFKYKKDKVKPFDEENVKKHLKGFGNKANRRKNCKNPIQKFEKIYSD